MPRLTPLGRERIVRQVKSGQTPEAVAEAARSGWQAPPRSSDNVVSEHSRAPCLVAGEQLGRRTPSRLVLANNT